MKYLLISFVFFLSHMSNYTIKTCNCDLVKEILSNKEFQSKLNLQDKKIIYIVKNKFCTINERISETIEVSTIDNYEMLNSKAIKILKLDKNLKKVVFYFPFENMEVSVTKLKNNFKIIVIEK